MGWKQARRGLASIIQIKEGRQGFISGNNRYRAAGKSSGDICSLYFSHLVPLPIQLTEAIRQIGESNFTSSHCYSPARGAGFVGLPAVQRFVQ